MTEKYYHITADDVYGDYGQENYVKLLENGQVKTVSPEGKPVVLFYEGEDNVVVQEISASENKEEAF